MRVRAPSWDDLEDVLALMRAADVAAVGETDWTESSLRSEWEELELARDAWVVELDDRIAAYTTFEDRGGGRLIADGYVHPDLRGRGVGSELLRVTEARAHEEIPRHPADVRVYLQNGMLLDDDCTPNLFARTGYVPVQHQFRMVTELSGEPVVPAVPEIEIRLYREPDERRTVHAVVEDAFTELGDLRSRADFDEWSRRVFGRGGFDPTLVWLALAGDDVVGANICGWKQGGDWGWVASLGVLPAWRGRGIGDALLRTAFAEFWRRGERRVALGVSAHNPTGATRLYERAGMHIAYTIVVYEKELRAAA